MNTEIIKIIEGGLENDKNKVIKFARQLSKNQKINGDAKLADRIEKLLDDSPKGFVNAEELLSKPVDPESRLDIVDVIDPDNSSNALMLPQITQQKVCDFVNGIKKYPELLDYGIKTQNSLLLYGPPGCGKTSIARQIAFMLNMPLVVARLDTMISSLLGNTSKNIKKIFSFANNKPCILFLDEFDAIAKARDDKNELGELKRVVNSLLQNIDDFIENNILIAATNHEKLLDKAVWRRFNSTIYVGMPDESIRSDLLKLYINNFETDFLFDKKKLKTISSLLEDSSPAEIKNIAINSIKNSIVAGKNTLEYSSFLYDLVVHKMPPETSNNVLMKCLSERGVSQESLKELFGVSLRQVRNGLID